MVRIRKYNIELSKIEKIFHLFVTLCCFALAAVCIWVPSPIIPKFLCTIFLLLLAYNFLDILINSKIIIKQDYISVHSGLFINKKIAIADISKVYEAPSDAFILRGNPVYSKNIIAIGYGQEKILYVSIRKIDEFIRYMDNLLHTKGTVDGNINNSSLDAKKNFQFMNKYYSMGLIAVNLVIAAVILIFFKLNKTFIGIAATCFMVSVGFTVFLYLMKKGKMNKNNIIIFCILAYVISITVLAAIAFS